MNFTKITYSNNTPIIKLNYRLYFYYKDSFQLKEFVNREIEKGICKRISKRIFKNIQKKIDFTISKQFDPIAILFLFYIIFDRKF
jgi:hypothetical protein